jgi:hypothetical protein
MRHPPDTRRIHIFRHWAPVFEALDHESGPVSAAVVAAGSAVLAVLALGEGRPVRDGVAGLTLVTFLALAALGAALVMAAGEALAWLLARPVGRDLARAAASLERARVAVARIRPILAADDVDLAPYTARIDRATGDLERRLAEADAAVVAYGALSQPATEAARLGVLLAEGRAIAAAAEALDAVAHLLRWIAACPWSPLRAEAVTRLSRDLAAAERLAADAS